MRLLILFLLTMLMAFDSSTCAADDGKEKPKKSKVSKKGVIKLPRNVPGWVTGEVKNLKDIEFEIPGDKGADGKRGDGKQPGDEKPEDEKSKEMVLGSGKDKWYHPNDEHDIGEAIASSREADHSHLDDTVDLSIYDKVAVNAHGTSDRDKDGDLDITYGRKDGSGYTNMDVEQLAQKLEANGFRGSSVELIVCNSTDYAQELANRLGVPVTSYPHNVTVCPITRRIQEYDLTDENNPVRKPARPVVKHPRRAD